MEHRMIRDIGIITIIAATMMTSTGTSSIAAPSAGTVDGTVSLNVSERVDAGLRAQIVRNFFMPEVAQDAPSYSLDNTTGGAAEFSISGEPSYVVTTSVPNVVLLNGTRNNNSSQLAVSSIVTADISAPTTPTSTITLDDNGAALVLVLGSRQSIPHTFANDTYTGTLTVFIAYL